MALRQEEFTSLCDDVDLDRDRVLVERCQAGDSSAFGNLYGRYYERLLRFCLRRLNDRHEAEDAAQEAFARAWKALPQFAGERRFYPWLTVIAGNICTDMLRRRSRSTPTDDLELTTHQPLGGGANETSEELILAAVDGELVNRALDRLSVRHRHVLAMREGSGWTYQQIADHEGVEIGTIETLLWRARQALKREFTVLSESKGALGGFLIGAGVLLRRNFLRFAHRSGQLQGSGGSGGLRNAMAGVAVTSAAVAAALITPHALTASGSTASTPPSAISSLDSTTLASGPLALSDSPSASPGSSASPLNATAASPAATSTSPSSAASTTGGAGTSGGATGTQSSITGSRSGTTGGGGGSASPGGSAGGAGEPIIPGTQGLSQTVGGAQSTVQSTVNSVTTGAANAVGSVVNPTLGIIGQIVPPTGSGAPSTSLTTPTAPPLVSGLTGGIGSTVTTLTGGL